MDRFERLTDRRDTTDAHELTDQALRPFENSRKDTNIESYGASDSADNNEESPEKIEEMSLDSDTKDLGNSENEEMSLDPITKDYSNSENEDMTLDSDTLPQEMPEASPQEMPEASPITPYNDTTIELDNGDISDLYGNRRDPDEVDHMPYQSPPYDDSSHMAPPYDNEDNVIDPGEGELLNPDGTPVTDNNDDAIIPDDGNESGPDDYK